VVGTWILPCLSVPREGSGLGTEEGLPLTHTQPGLLGGDRTSGFNGLRTSGPPGLHPGRGTGRRPRQEAFSLEDKLPPGGPSSTNVSLLFAKTSVGNGALGISGASEE